MSFNIFFNRSLLSKILLFLVSFSFCIFLAEIFLQWYSPPLYPNIGTYKIEKSKLYGWAFEPNSKQIFVNPDTSEVSYFYLNSQGWKDVEHEFPKSENTIRILFLGDSNTWGIVSLDDLYTRKVEELLHEFGYNNVEVISIGLSAWGTDHALEALINEGIHYDPDFVVYQFCDNDVDGNIAPNDTTNPKSPLNLKPFRYVSEGGKLQKYQRVVGSSEKVNNVNILKKRILEVIRYSAIIYNIKLAMQSYFDNEKNRKKIVLETMKNNSSFSIESEKFDSQPHRMTPNLLDPTQTWYRFGFGEQSEIQKSAWNLLDLLINELNEISKKNGADFILFSESGEEGKREWYLRWNLFQTDGKSDFINWNGKRYPFNWKRPMDNLNSIAKKYFIPLIEQKRKYTRYKYDLHPNKEGNLNIALDIVDYFVKSKRFQYLESIKMKKGKIIAEQSHSDPVVPWDFRDRFEIENNIVTFSDCGFYDEDTEEILGAKCQYRNGQWYLIDPKISQSDNLLQNEDMSFLINNPVINFASPAIISCDTVDKKVLITMDVTKGGGCQASFYLNKSKIPNINNHYITLRSTVKQIQGDVNILIGYLRDSDSVQYGKYSETILTSEDQFEQRFTTDFIDFSDITTKSWFYVLISCHKREKTKVLLSELILLNGIFPMAFSM